jgi:SAM-dependent methyltransferase
MPRKLPLIQPVLAIARGAVEVDARAARRAAHDHDIVFRSLLARLRERLGESLSRARVLDFGCGFTYPLVALLQPHVGEVVGLDVAPVFRDGPLPALRSAGGLRKPGSAAEALLSYAGAARYYRHLARRGVRLRHDACRIVRYAGEDPPFEPASFDCVVSNAVLQELPRPLDAHAGRIARLLRPGGHIDLEWHSFYSLSGRYRSEDEARRDPWGHLLGGSYHPSLNRATPDEVVEAFAPWFRDLRLLRHDRDYRIAGSDPAFQTEGEELLTPDLRARLEEYPEELLLTRGYILQGVRR